MPPEAPLADTGASAARSVPAVPLTAIELTGNFPPANQPPMDRLITFWKKHLPTLATDSQGFVSQHSAVKRYGKNQVIKLTSERFPFFCVVLDGLVAGYRANSEGKPLLTELMLPSDYFTGTQHPFTPRIREAEYVALLPTTLLLMPIAEARDAQRRYPAFSELVQVMKQRKINFLELLLAIESEKRCYPRYEVFMQDYPQHAYTLPPSVQWQILRMGKTSFYRVKGRYLRKK